MLLSKMPAILAQPRRANQQHFFIIAKSVEPAAGAQRRLFGVTSGETP